MDTIIIHSMYLNPTLSFTPATNTDGVVKFDRFVRDLNRGGSRILRREGLNVAHAKRTAIFKILLIIIFIIIDISQLLYSYANCRLDSQKVSPPFSTSVSEVSMR